MCTHRHEMPTRPTPRKYSPIRHCPEYRGGKPNRIQHSPPTHVVAPQFTKCHVLYQKRKRPTTRSTQQHARVSAPAEPKMHCCDSAHLFVLVQRHAPLTKDESLSRQDEPAHSGTERDSTRTCAIPAEDNMTLTRRRETKGTFARTKMIQRNGRKTQTWGYRGRG